MPKKKIAKYQRDIAAAQAISACSQSEVSREDWWEMLRAVKPGDYETLKKVVNTKCPSAYSDLENANTEED